MKVVLSILLNLSVLYFIKAQDCTIQLSGKISDPHHELSLEFASVYIEETGQYGETDSSGNYQIHQICPGDYHLTIRHIGCETKSLFLRLTESKIVNIEMEHHAYYLQSVTVEDHKNRNESSTQNTLKTIELFKDSGKPLSSILENISGVYSIKNGSGISKPVIHGLTGNRVSILNNGVLQAGQQWGADHAPEIDPLSAQQITVIKGVDAIPYGGNSLGGIILTESGPVDRDPHIHGSTLVHYQSNGQLVYSGIRMEQARVKYDWRITGSVKISGDHKSPDYYLTNTGNRELGSSAEWIRNIHNVKQHKIYYSFFYSEPGILRGSHIGNLTDLETAIRAETPFFTKDHFSYRIESPRQQIEHHILKWNYQQNDSNKLLEIQASSQLNHRKEFDVRRGSRSDIPALDLLLQSYSLDIKQRYLFTKDVLYYGLQSKFNVNHNQAGTGILPLIPDYNLFNAAAFANWKHPWSNTILELGARYDLIHQQAHPYSISLPRTILNEAATYHNVSTAIGIRKKMLETWEIRLNIGYTKRSPEINERYSFGLHQAVAGIEEGTRSLVAESSLKAILTQSINVTEHFNLEWSSYSQYIQDFIFLEPQQELRLTIRGAFPLFIYKQTNAVISGMDFLGRCEFARNWQLHVQAAILKGVDLNQKNSLVAMPPNNISTSLSYQLIDFWKLKNLKIVVQAKQVFKSNVKGNRQEFLPAPEGYFLLNPSIETEFKGFSKNFKLQLLIENALNTSYRDYLNRLRYFADEEGLSLNFNLKMNF